MPMPSVRADDGWGPPPDERKNYIYKREPGQFKRTPMGFLDPTPDVIPLAQLPTDKFGFVDWARALRDNIIAPRDFLEGINTRIPEDQAVNNSDVLIKAKLEFMPDVIFPHSAHTPWLKCSTCHPRIFIARAGATPISMTGIWKGQFCGRCHDRVAFPIRNCFKCHSVPRSARAGPNLNP